MQFQKLDPRAIAPSRNNLTDAGVDLYALEEVVVRPGEIVQVRTGIAVSSTTTKLFWGKSGRAWKNGQPVGLTVLAGCIDESYRGELLVVVANLNISPVLDRYIQEGVFPPSSIICIPYGNAICQMISVNLELEELTEVEQLDPTDRGPLGFGSSDKL